MPGCLIPGRKEAAAWFPRLPLKHGSKMLQKQEGQNPQWHNQKADSRRRVTSPATMRGFFFTATQRHTLFMESERNKEGNRGDTMRMLASRKAHLQRVIAVQTRFRHRNMQSTNLSTYRKWTRFRIMKRRRDGAPQTLWNWQTASRSKIVLLMFSHLAC